MGIIAIILCMKNSGMPLKTSHFSNMSPVHQRSFLILELDGIFKRCPAHMCWRTACISGFKGPNRESSELRLTESVGNQGPHVSVAYYYSILIASCIWGVQNSKP